MESIRLNKVNRLLQRELGVIFQQELKGSFGKAMITVTRVSVTKDLAIARIHLSLFGGENKKELFEKIVLNSKEIRHHLGTRLRHQLRVIPDPEFFLDDTLDYIDHIDELLKQ